MKTFAKSSQTLAKNPLGIIALFILLVYGFATIFTSLGLRDLTSWERMPLVWFLALFPVVVLGVFGWLVAFHHTNLYAPSDFKDEKNWVNSVKPNANKLTQLQQLSTSDVEKKGGMEGNDEFQKFLPEIARDRSDEREMIYQKNHGIFLADLLSPLDSAGSTFDIVIYLVKHPRIKGSLSDVVSAEFFFGEYWGNQIIPASKIGDLIGVRTTAYGSFLATCHVTFKDGDEITLERYIDLGMGHVLVKALASARVSS